jgi:nitroreductase
MSDSVLDMIMQRRSVRSFTGEPVTKSQLETILKAAMAAPSARNGQPWRFLVFTDKAKIKELCLAHPHASWGVSAGAVIVPYFEKQAKNYYIMQDMAAATQNLLLAAAGLGLGATWCGMPEERQELVRPATGLDEKYWLFAVIPVGVPAETPPPRTQYDDQKILWK